MKSRDNTIDSVAGVMIVYMIFTHVCQHFGLAQSTLYLSLERVLYFFMPWFFFKAGMFFSLKDDKEVVRASASRLLKPFIIYTLLGHAVYVIVCAVKGNLSLSVLFPVRQLVLNGSITGNLPLWFLLTLFICRILLNLIGKTKGRVLALCLLSLVAAFLMHLANFDHPYYLANTMTGLTFICLGYIVKKNYPPGRFRLNRIICRLLFIPVFCWDAVKHPLLRLLFGLDIGVSGRHHCHEQGCVERSL